MTEPTRQDRRTARGRRRRTSTAIAAGVALVLAVAVAVFFVGFRDDDAPASKRPGPSTSASVATTAPTDPSALDSTAPPTSAPPDSAAPAATTAAPGLGSAPPENINASGAGCGGDNQPAIAGTWQTTAPRSPADGDDVDLALRQQDGTQVAGLPVTAVVTAPSGRTFAANPVAVAPNGADAGVSFPRDFPTADRFRLDGNAGDYQVRWQTLGGGALACDHFQVG